MKSIIKTLLVAITVFTCTIKAYTQDSGIFVEANLGLTHSSEIISYDGTLGYDFRQEKCNYTNTLFDVRLGYRFSKHVVLGAMFKKENYERIGHYPCWGAFIEYNFKNFHSLPLYAFIDLHCYHGKDSDSKFYGDKYILTEAGFSPGIGFHIPKTPIDLKLRYLFIGYNETSIESEFGYSEPFREYKQVGGCLGRGNWIIDAGIRRLEIGLSATLNLWRR